MGHFEFGLDRRPINPGDHGAVVAIEDCRDAGEEVRGWAKYWALMYRHLADRLEADPEVARRTLVVRYEELCDRAPAVMTAVCEHIGVPATRAEGLAVGLHQPDYYTVQFTDADYSAIVEETSAVAARFGYRSIDRV